MSLEDGVTLITLPDGRLGMIEPVEKNQRVFRRCGPYHEFLEWSYKADIDKNGSRARWYGFASKELPSTMTNL